ncbi:MAG: hypothetical protein PHN82_00215 [bacterium]|nr:hypothetical protein [bacterium]
MDILTPAQLRKVRRIQRNLLPGEMDAILTHKYLLSRQSGRDVGLEYAILDWDRHHAKEWRAARMREDVACQFQEMLRHKWIESEKAGRDIGKEAFLDWIWHHAKEWRDLRERKG